MKIVIPMSGVGQRFIDAGYKEVKPLIKIDGRPMIEYIVSLFPGEKDIIFVCNNEHLEKTEMEKVLNEIAPSARVIGIDPHKKGPVYAVSKIFDLIQDDEEVIIQHCDTYKYWNFKDFLTWVRDRNSDAAISGNIGFHPLMFSGTNYALASASEQWMTSLTEKKPLEDINKEYASDGTYYFSKGSLVKKYFQEVMDANINLNDEYYVSLVYPLMLRDKLDVSIYEVQHVQNLGIPYDVDLYEFWADVFKKFLVEKEETSGGHINIMLLAGRGSRFLDEGYKNPKPLIEISGKPMVAFAHETLPRSDRNIFACLTEHLENFGLDEVLEKYVPKCEIVELKKVTKGQACTCEQTLKNVSPESSVLVAACDNISLLDMDEYNAVLADKSVDAFVFGANHVANSKNNPNSYSWIKTDDDNNVIGISTKKSISDEPFNDYIITGTFFFRRTSLFLEALKHLYTKKRLVNGEYYLETCIDELVNLGYKAKLLPVEKFISWGTPVELKTFEYWQSFFHKDKFHPYAFGRDTHANKRKTKALVNKCSDFNQKYF